MFQENESRIVLMVQSAYLIFCYYGISPISIKKFEDMYGEGAWRNSQPMLKVAKIVDGISEELESIYLDPIADNWYINLKEDDIKIYVRLGRILTNGEFVTIAVSNEVITPREVQSEDTSIKYINISGEILNAEETQIIKNDEEYSLKKNMNLIIN